MAEKTLIKKILRIIIENKSSLAALATAMIHYTEYLHSTMRCCDTDDCASPVTVHNEHIGFYACDTCAARAIIRGAKELRDPNRDKELDPVREAMAREELWIDLSAAMAIRMIDNHHRLIVGNHPDDVRTIQ